MESFIKVSYDPFIKLKKPRPQEVLVQLFMAGRVLSVSGPTIMRNRDDVRWLSALVVNDVLIIHPFLHKVNSDRAADL